MVASFVFWTVKPVHRKTFHENLKNEQIILMKLNFSAFPHSSHQQN